MEGPTTVEPDPMLTRARRVWVSLAARVLPQEQQLGHGVTEEMLVGEVQGELEQLRDEHALEIAALEAALAEARSRATQIRPVSGTAAQWKERLAAMPPLASHEIEAWNNSALRRLAAIGTTQADVTIVRLCEMLLRPYRDVPSADAETP